MPIKYFGTLAGVTNYLRDHAVHRYKIILASMGTCTLRVPQKDLEKVRGSIMEITPMGVVVFINPLRWWECRLKRRQIRDR